MSALVEAGLRSVLVGAVSAEGPQPALPLLPTRDGGGHLVNIDDREALYRAMGQEYLPVFDANGADLVARHSGCPQTCSPNNGLRATHKARGERQGVPTVRIRRSGLRRPDPLITS